MVVTPRRTDYNLWVNCYSSNYNKYTDITYIASYTTLKLSATIEGRAGVHVLICVEADVRGVYSGVSQKN